MKTDMNLLKWHLERYFKEKRIPIWIFGQNNNIEYTNFVTSALLNLMEHVQTMTKKYVLAHSIEGFFLDDSNPYELYFVFSYTPGKHNYTVVVGPVLTIRPSDRVWGKLSFSGNVFSEQKKVLVHMLSVMRKEDFLVEITNILNDIFEIPAPDFSDELNILSGENHFSEDQICDDISILKITDYKRNIKLKELYRFYIQSGNTYQLYALLANEENLDVLFPKKASLQDCLFRVVELLTIGAGASVENGHDKKACYILYHNTTERLKSAKCYEKLLTILKETSISLAKSTREINVYTSKDYSPTTNKCIQLIVAKMPEKITLDGLAEELHISAKYLSVLFNKETGSSIPDFIQDIRINEAKTLLLSSDLTYLEISNMLNFNSQSYFNQIFKKKTGLTPKEFKTKIDNHAVL
ncbi:MAG: AraC family transcriptional regulator [Butyrivibrio sp.]|nr:AraC family transcriptional regulator [Butyrivibrio sp.]